MHRLRAASGRSQVLWAPDALRLREIGEAILITLLEVEANRG
jgi:hypothetical protein